MVKRPGTCKRFIEKQFKTIYDMRAQKSPFSGSFPQNECFLVNIFNDSGYALPASNAGCYNAVFFLLSF